MEKICMAVWKNEKFSLTKKLFHQIKSFINLLTYEFSKDRYFHEILAKNAWYTVWKFANFSPTMFCKNSVKSTFH